MDLFDFNNDGKLDVAEEFMAYQSYLQWEADWDEAQKNRVVKDTPQVKKSVPEEPFNLKFCILKILYLICRYIFPIGGICAFLSAGEEEKSFAFGYMLVVSAIGIGLSWWLNRKMWDSL